VRLLLLLLTLSLPAWADDEGPDAPRAADPVPQHELPPPNEIPSGAQVQEPPTIAAPPWAPPPPPPVAAVTREHTTTWPYTLHLNVVIGAELHGHGQPVAFGMGGEGLWRGWVGVFASLLASSGGRVVVAMGDPPLGDRVSVPFGLAIRPFGAMAQKRDGWGWKLLGGVGAQLGATVEHIRTSADSSTTGGMHLALAVDVPVYGGPIEGGVALRAMGRVMVTPEVTLPSGVHTPIASGQIFVGVVYTP
jgi:hypothetical protein